MSKIKPLHFLLPRNLHSNRYFAESHVTQKTQGQTPVWGQKRRLHDLILKTSNQYIPYKPIHAHQYDKPGAE